MDNFHNNENFGQKWKFWPKMEIVAKNGNFGQQRKFFTKMAIVSKRLKFRAINRHFGQKYNFF